MKLAVMLNSDELLELIESQTGIAAVVWVAMNTIGPSTRNDAHCHWWVKTRVRSRWNTVPVSMVVIEFANHHQNGRPVKFSG